MGSNSAMTGSLLPPVRLRPIAEAAGLTMTHLTLAWVLREPCVSSAIVGASQPEQVADNAAVSGVSLGDDVLVAIDQVLTPVAQQ